MSNLLQERYKVQLYFEQLIFDTIQNNNIPNYMAEDALNSVLLKVKERTLKDYFVSIQENEDKEEENISDEVFDE